MLKTIFSEKTLNCSEEARRIQDEYDKLVRSKDVKNWDDDFFAKFNGKYYMGLPLNYYFRVRNLGYCYTCAVVFAVTLDNCDICTGDLTIGKNVFEHRWVEKDGFVYDTTYQFTVPKKLYYNFFAPKKVKRISKRKYFAQKKWLDRCTYDYETLSKMERIPTIEKIFNSAADFTKDRIANAKDENDRKVCEAVYDELIPSCKDLPLDGPVFA